MKQSTIKIQFIIPFIQRTNMQHFFKEQNLLFINMKIFIKFELLFFQKVMGNQICCQDTATHNDMQPIPSMPKHESNKVQSKISERLSKNQSAIKLPQLSANIKDHIASQKPFASMLIKDPKIYKYGSDIFQGNVDSKGKPWGYGKMYKNDGSLFIGNFQEGIANGPGRYIMEDGSYYAGNFKNNQANDDNAIFIRENPYLQYRGGIKNNEFHGNGFEKSRKYEYKGQYKNGQKTKGVLKWDTVSGNADYQYEYEGPFDDKGLFHGKGKLKQIRGTYQGQFYHGKKEGKGVYLYKSGIKYDGDYKEGYKNGFGTIYNADDSISYKGSWKDGIPHGKGQIFNDKGKSFPAQLVEGIDIQHL